MSQLHKLSVDELYREIGANAAGLSGSEVRHRQDRFGPNELRVRQDVPEIVKFLLQFRNFFALLLIFGGGLAIIAEHLDPGQGNLYIAIALFSVVLLNAVFTYLQEHQSERILESFRQMLPAMVTVVRDRQTSEVAAVELVPGDIIILREGDRVPADGRILSANEFKVDQSSLTGESEPQLLGPEFRHVNILESRNMVFSGTLVQNGEARVLVCGTGMSTQIGSIVELTKATDVAEAPIHRELRHFIRIISTIAISLGVLFFLVSIAIGKGEIGSLIFAIGIIVANVPEGLLPTVTLSLTMASKRMARKNALIKNLESVETLGSTTVICTDKTGTLTQNRLGVNTLVLGTTEYALDRAGNPDNGSLSVALETMVLCNSAELVDDGYVGDATEGALLLCAQRFTDVVALRRAEKIAEQPFNSASKRMITVAKPQGAVCPHAYLKGAPEVVLEMCSAIVRDDETIALDDDQREAVMAAYRRLAARGERGLAFAWREAESGELPEEGFVFVGLVGMIDPPRSEVPLALEKCRTAGIRVTMLTGDYGLTAETIARQIGLITGPGKIVSGDELADLSDTELALLLSSERDLVFARIAPAQKLRVVQAYQALDEIVTVTGDGVNDALALKHADMGVSMGLMGTDVAKEASDMILMDGNFATIVSAIEEGRAIFDNIKKFIAYILTSNIPEILPFIAFVLLDIPLPLTVVLILLIDLGTDLVPALGLGAERPETDVMHKAPRPRNERLLSRNLLLMSYVIVGMIQAAAGFFTYFVILYWGGWTWGQELASSDPLYRTAITDFFASIIICQISDVLICRTRRQSIFAVGVFSNRLVWLGIASEILLLALISYVPFLNIFFGTAPLEAWHLALSVPFAMVILFGDELRRMFVRRGNPFVLKWLTW